MITKDVKNGMISGVCAGLAKSLDTDPTIVRLIFALSLFLSGIGLLAYLVLWIIMPDN